MSYLDLASAPMSWLRAKDPKFCDLRRLRAPALSKTTGK